MQAKLRKILMKYDNLVGSLKDQLSTKNKILIALPASLSVDRLASGLSLALSMRNAGKSVTVVSEGDPLVSHSNLFGVGEVKNQVSSTTGGGNFIISLEGVVDSTGTMQTVPALEKLDWYPEGANLNLVFHVVPGQRFEPTKVNYRNENSGFDLIFVLGANTLDELGVIYTQNPQIFTSAQIVNIDNSGLNSNFGAINIVDNPASSLSEIVANLMPSLGLILDKDIASNIIAGIYEATSNLTAQVNADTFAAVSQALQAGAVVPGQVQAQSQAQPQAQNVAPQPVAQPEPQVQVQTPVQSQPQPTVQPQFQSPSPFIVVPDVNTQISQAPIQPQVSVPQEPIQPVQPQPQAQPQAQPQVQMPNFAGAPAQGFDLRQVFQIPQMPAGSLPSNPDNFSVPPVVNAEEVKPQAKTQDVSSPEERPMAEYVGSSSPEMDSQPTPDWLVPKIFKGVS